MAGAPTSLVAYISLARTNFTTSLPSRFITELADPSNSLGQSVARRSPPCHQMDLPTYRGHIF